MVNRHSKLVTHPSIWPLATCNNPRQPATTLPIARSLLLGTHQPSLPDVVAGQETGVSGYCSPTQGRPYENIISGIKKPSRRRASRVSRNQVSAFELDDDNLLDPDLPLHPEDWATPLNLIEPETMCGVEIFNEPTKVVAIYPKTPLTGRPLGQHFQWICEHTEWVEIAYSRALRFGRPTASLQSIRE